MPSQRNAFLDPVTSRLKCHGFVQTNDPGDVVLPVPEDFALNPRDGWKWDGADFVAFPFPPLPDRLATAKAKVAAVAGGPIREALDEILKVL